MFKKSLIVLFLVMVVAGFSMSSVCATNDGINGKFPTKLTLDPISKVILKDTVNISGRLDKKLIGVNSSIANQPISITIIRFSDRSSEKFKTTTDDKGVFSLAYTPSNTGFYEVVAIFNGNLVYRASVGIGIFNVVKL
jgi:hypothetical protein